MEYVTEENEHFSRTKMFTKEEAEKTLMTADREK